MEVQDGFIVGIYNYCDRWCERCPLTGRCRVFATLAEIDFEEGNGPLTEPRSSRERRRIEMQGIALHVASDDFDEDDPASGGTGLGRLPADMERSTGPDPELVANAAALHKKLKGLKTSANPTVRLAMETIRYYALLVPVKMARVLSQVAQNGPGDQQSDANGSGKVALLALDRMDGAWRMLVDTHHLSARDAAPFLAEIARMQRNLNRAVPAARAFVRPGFDEPDEVRMLEAAEC